MASISVELNPWLVPSFVVPVDDGMKPVPLSEVANTTLSQMCNEFREGVFKTAGKVDPNGFHTR